MEQEWYYQLDDRIIGPLTPDDLLQRSASGTFPPNTPIRKGLQGTWVRADRVQLLRGVFDRRSPGNTEIDETRLIHEKNTKASAMLEDAGITLQHRTPLHYEEICLLFCKIHFVSALISGALAVFALFAAIGAHDEAWRSGAFQLFIVFVLSTVACLFSAWTWEVVSGYFVLKRQSLDLLRELVANTRPATAETNRQAAAGS